MEEKTPPAEDITCIKKNVGKSDSTIAKNGDFESESGTAWCEEDDPPDLESKSLSTTSIQLDFDALELEGKNSSANFLDNILLGCDSSCSTSTVSLPRPSGLPFAHFDVGEPFHIDADLDIPFNTLHKSNHSLMRTAESDCQVDLLNLKFTNDSSETGTLTIRSLCGEKQIVQDHLQSHIVAYDHMDKNRFASSFYNSVLLMNQMQNCARAPIMQGWLSDHVPNWKTFFSRPVLFGLLLSCVAN